MSQSPYYTIPRNFFMNINLCNINDNWFQKNNKKSTSGELGYRIERCRCIVVVKLVILMEFLLKENTAM